MTAFSTHILSIRLKNILEIHCDIKKLFMFAPDIHNNKIKNIKKLWHYQVI